MYKSLKDSGWSSTTWSLGGPLEECDAGSYDCAEYLVILSNNSLPIAKKIEHYFNLLDVIVDCGYGAASGKLRIVSEDADSKRIYYKIANRVI